MRRLLALASLSLLALTACGSAGRPPSHGLGIMAPHHGAPAPKAAPRVHLRLSSGKYGSAVTPFLGEVFTTTNGGWSNCGATGTGCSYAYAWKHSSGGAYTTASGSPTNTSSYTTVSGDVGDTLEVTVTATNTDGSASQTSLATGTVVAGPAGPTGHTFTLAWNDEFNNASGMSGPSNGLSLSHWDQGWQIGPGSLGTGRNLVSNSADSGSTINYNDPASVSFPGDDAAHLRLQAGANGGAYTDPSIGGTKKNSWAMLSTAGLLAFNPANVAVDSSLAPYTINGPSVLEFRARFPGPNTAAAQYWQGVWMTNAGNYDNAATPNGSLWPGGTSYQEEIDLWEFGAGGAGSGGSLAQDYAFTMHTGGSLGSATTYGGVQTDPSGLNGTDLSLAYHTYTVEFTATTIKVWVDGVQSTTVTPGSTAVAQQWTFPQYLMFHSEALAGAENGSGSLLPTFGPTTAASTPSDFMIDYVRVWRES